jgi:phospholipid/cholesterol/gamma-HCH transport system permease protein
VILEFAPTFISVIMAGKWVFITSSIGTMRVTEQIDALEVMGVNSLNYLVFPKIIALLLYPFLINRNVSRCSWWLDGRCVWWIYLK